MREARTLNQPSPLTAHTNVERELSLINLSLRQQLVGFDNCCKSLKSIVAQLRIIASYFENKLREYNKNVEVITTSSNRPGRGTMVVHTMVSYMCSNSSGTMCYLCGYAYICLLCLGLSNSPISAKPYLWCSLCWFNCVILPCWCLWHLCVCRFM